MGLDLIHLIILNAGIILLLAVAMGKFVSLIKAPKVTGYLIIGIILGPSVMGHYFPVLQAYMLSSEITDIYMIITEIGLGLIIFNVGGEFKFEHIGKLGKKVFLVSIFEITFTFVIVFLLSFIGFLLFYESSFSETITKEFSFAILLGVVAIATAPAATLLVLREYESEGPITDYLLVLIGLNNIVCIVLFKIFFSLFISESATISEPFLEIFVSIVLGIAVGLLVSFVEKWLEKAEILILVVGGITLNIGLVSLFENILPSLFPTIFTEINISNLLANLFMGITLINSSTKGDVAFKALKRAEMPVYVLFFVLAGANLHLEELQNAGILFVIYVIARALGKYLGANIGLKYLGIFSRFKNNIGMALLPQAGVAIGLAFILKNAGLSMGNTIASIVLSGVIIFEFIGPLFTRFAIVRGGEVKEISLSKKKWTRNKRVYLRVWLKLRQSLGFRQYKPNVKIRCKDIMRSSVEVLFNSDPFGKVLKFASKYKYEQFMVIDKDGHFVGIISYSEIRDILFDDTLSQLIIAKDIVKEDVFTAKPTNSIQELMNMFHASNTGEYLPVLDDHEPPHVIGMVTQKDTLSVYKKIQ